MAELENTTINGTLTTGPITVRGTENLEITFTNTATHMSVQLTDEILYKLKSGYFPSYKNSDSWYKFFLTNGKLSMGLY